MKVLLVLLVLLALAGCGSPTVKPHVAPSDFLTAEQRINGQVDLFVSEAFKSYTVAVTDVSEMKEWQFELGPAAIDAFRFALESRFTDVSVQLGDPRFPVDNARDVYAVIQPSFKHFETSDPVIFKFENYKVNIAFGVSVYNKNGEIILSRTYVGEAIEQGSIGFDDPGYAAYPTATENAIKKAVEQLIHDLALLSMSRG